MILGSGSGGSPTAEDRVHGLDGADSQSVAATPDRLPTFVHERVMLSL